MGTKVRHRPIVNYTGTITDLHGLWRVDTAGERLTLRSAYGLSLVNVRRSSVQPVEVPTLTPKRADALLDLHDRRTGAHIHPRVRTWLTAQQLAQVDEEDGRRLCLTALGFELAAAIYRYSY